MENPDYEALKNELQQAKQALSDQEEKSRRARMRLLNKLKRARQIRFQYAPDADCRKWFDNTVHKDWFKSHIAFDKINDQWRQWNGSDVLAVKLLQEIGEIVDDTKSKRIFYTEEEAET